VKELFKRHFDALEDIYLAEQRLEEQGYAGRYGTTQLRSEWIVSAIRPSRVVYTE
jgi:predicted DNA-binding protein